MQGCRVAHRGEEREGLPRALRSSSKFSLLFIFQVPAKLAMSAECEFDGCRKNLFHALMSRCSLSHPPLSLCLCSGLSLSFTQLHPTVSFMYSFFFPSSQTDAHTPSVTFFFCVSQCAATNLVSSSFIAAVINRRQRRSLPPESSVP